MTTNDQLFELHITNPTEYSFQEGTLKFCGVDLPVTRILLDINSTGPVMTFAVPANKVKIVVDDITEEIK